MRPSIKDRGRRLDATAGQAGRPTPAGFTVRGARLLRRAHPAFPGTPSVVSTGVLSVPAVAGRGGGSTTTVTASGAAGEAAARRCDVTAGDGGIHDIEIGLSTTEESPDPALEDEKTVAVAGGPAGVAHLRSGSRSIFEAIHREVNETRRTLRPC